MCFRKHSDFFNVKKSVGGNVLEAEAIKFNFPLLRSFMILSPRVGTETSNILMESKH